MDRLVLAEAVTVLAVLVVLCSNGCTARCVVALLSTNCIECRAHKVESLQKHIVAQHVPPRRCIVCIGRHQVIGGVVDGDRVECCFVNRFFIVKDSKQAIWLAPSVLLITWTGAGSCDAIFQDHAQHLNCVLPLNQLVKLLMKAPSQSHVICAGNPCRKHHSL